MPSCSVFKVMRVGSKLLFLGWEFLYVNMIISLNCLIEFGGILAEAKAPTR